MEFKAVVLAAGKGSRMVDLTSQMPKCLLPIGGLPMIWYPLRQLQDAGVEQAVVVISEQMPREHRSQIVNIPQQYKLDIGVEVFEVSGRDDPGTADTLRQLAAAGRQRSCSEQLVVSCDLVTAAPLRQLLSQHRLRSPSLTALFATQHRAADLGRITAPGPKSRHKPERDLIALSLTEPEPRLCMLASEADYEDEVAIRVALLRKQPRLIVRRDLLDAHLYLLAPGMRDYITDGRDMTSLKGEVIPEIIRAQFHRPRVVDFPSVERDSPHTKSNANDFVRPERFSELTRRFTAPVAPPQKYRPATSCYAWTTDEMTWRVNTIPAYLSANRAVVQLWETLPPPRPERLHPDASIPANRVQIGPDCVVGASTTLCEKTTLASSTVGRHCSLGTRLRISDCVVMDYVTISDDVILNNCILMPYCCVEAGAELRDCVVGVRQVVAAGEKKTREVISQEGGSMEVY